MLLRELSSFAFCHACSAKVHRNLLVTAQTMPSFDTRLHEIPFIHVTIGDRPAASGARIAIITMPSRNYDEALTIFELVRQTKVPLPRSMDTRGTRFAACWWMQPRGDEVSCTYTAA